MMEKRGIIDEENTPPEWPDSLKKANEKIAKEREKDLEDHVTKRASDKVEKNLKS